MKSLLKYLPVLIAGGLAVILSFFIPMVDVFAAEIDPDAVWQNIADLQQSVGDLQSDYDFVRSEYESLQQLVDDLAVQNDNLVGLLGETNELLRYMITGQEMARLEDAQLFADFKLYLTDLSMAASGDVVDAVITSVSGNDLILQEINQRQADDMSNADLADNLLVRLDDVSGNTLLVAGQVDSSNQLLGIVVAGVVLVVVLMFVGFLAYLLLRHLFKFVR